MHAHIQARLHLHTHARCAHTHVHMHTRACADTHTHTRAYTHIVHGLARKYKNTNALVRKQLYGQTVIMNRCSVDSISHAYIYSRIQKHIHTMHRCQKHVDTQDMCAQYFGPVQKNLRYNSDTHMDVAIMMYQSGLLLLSHGLPSQQRVQEQRFFNGKSFSRLCVTAPSSLVN
jgi:hypothetical protein